MSEENVMAWRLMANLSVIRDDVKWHFRPAPIVWSIGDAKHAKGPSDHNPEDFGFGLVVSAIDVVFPSSLEKQVSTLAKCDAVVRACIGRPDLSYVIHNRRIWSYRTLWLPHVYLGENPHRYHVHISSRHTLKADRTREHLKWSK